MESVSRKHQRRPIHNHSHSSDELTGQIQGPGHVRRRSEESSYSAESAPMSSFVRDHADEDFLLLRGGGKRGSTFYNFDDDDGAARIFSFNTSTVIDHDDPENKQRRSTNFRCIGLCLSIIMTIILLALSGINITWTLDAGESRRIETPIMSRQIVVKAIHSSSRRPLNAVVYALTSCPPLTGPPLTLSETRVLNLSVEEYQYDYFYLNAGSTISMNATQTQGTSKLYILEGKNALRRLQTPGPEDDPFGIDSVAEGSITKSEGNATLSYTVKRSDTYTLAYDNPSATNPSQLTTTYSVVLTTYDLEKYEPQCSKLSDIRPCKIKRPDKGSCLLIQADKDTRPEGLQVVTVKIHSNRRWFPILIFSVIPYLFGWLAAFYCRPKPLYHAVQHREDQHSVDPDFENNLEGPSLPLEVDESPLQLPDSAAAEANIIDS